MKKTKEIYIYKYLTSFAFASLSSLTAISCVKNEETNINNDSVNQIDNIQYVDIGQYLRDLYPKYVVDSKISEKTIDLSNDVFLSYYRNGIASLSLSEGNKDANGIIENLYCTSERQAIALYGVCGGHFGNVYLHKQETPPNAMVNRRFINLSNLGDKQEFAVRGSYYKYIDQALSRAEAPTNLIVYHGIEFMENEFGDQLQPFIKYQEDQKKYDYSNCVGQEITSYGFLSTTTDKMIAINFSNGEDGTQDTPTFAPPLKENAIFKIKINKNQEGVAYISGFDITSGLWQGEAQFLIKRNSKFKIEKVTKENDINIFEIVMIS